MTLEKEENEWQRLLLSAVSGQENMGPMFASASSGWLPVLDIDFSILTGKHLNFFLFLKYSHV